MRCTRTWKNPLRLVFVEEWADQAALAAHFAVPASRAFARALGALAVEPPRIQVFEARRTTG
jgi:quinol monooxygenase YgiN